MRTVRLILGFDGTRYEGWQSQKKDKTIQEVFEKILARILKEKTHLAGSSRTDSGVHARHFVAHFRTKSGHSDAVLKKALNFHLPKDILVYSAKTMPDGFHARFGAKFKIYQYDIWNSPTRPLFEAPYVLWHPQRLDVRLMRRAAAYLRGCHDFSAFKDEGGDTRSHVRTLRRLTVMRKGSHVRITAEGDGFLRHMVRVLAGTLIEAGRGRLSPERVRDILRSRDRRLAGPTAKPQGLCLVKVKY